MEILEFKSTISEKFMRGSTVDLKWQKEELVNLKTAQKKI